jgi:hypothetical protein
MATEGGREPAAVTGDAEPVGPEGTVDPEETAPARSESMSTGRNRTSAILSILRLSAVQLLGAAFMLLAGAAAAVALAQFTADHRAPYISIGLSFAAIVSAVTAVVAGSRG